MFGRSAAVVVTALSLIGPLIGSINPASGPDAITAHALLTAPAPAPGPRPPSDPHPPSDKAAPKGPTELTDLRGPATTSFRFPNGSRSVLMATGRLRTSSDAAWQPINLTLRQDPDGTVRPIGPAYATELSGGGRVNEAASVQGPTGVTTTLPWSGTLPTPTIAQNRAVYRQARPGSDLIIEATRTGFVATLVPTSAPGEHLSATRVDDPLRLRITQPDGSNTADTIDSLVDQIAPPGRLGDGPVADRVVATAVRQTTPPFSTTVQNTTPTGGALGERTADPDLRVGSFDGRAVSRGYLTWDLSGLRGQPVTKATLRLFEEWAPTCDPQAVQVWSTGAIDPAAGWADQPTPERLWTTTSATKGHGGCPAGWISLDVTPLVREWARTGVDTGTVMLRAADETDPRGWKRFTSGEGLKPPTLGITLAAPTQ